MKPKKPATNAAVKWEQLAAAVLEMRKNMQIQEERIRLLEDQSIRREITDTGTLPLLVKIQ